MRWEDFNFATLMLLKDVDQRFNMSSWSKEIFDKWSRVYRSYCGCYFETYASFEMCAGDLLDWWEERKDILINMVEQCLRQVRYPLLKILKYFYGIFW